MVVMSPAVLETTSAVVIVPVLGVVAVVVELAIGFKKPLCATRYCCVVGIVLNWSAEP